MIIVFSIFLLIYTLIGIGLLPIKSNKDIYKSIRIRNISRKLLIIVFGVNIIVLIFFADFKLNGKLFGDNLSEIGTFMDFTTLTLLFYYLIQPIKKLFQPIYTTKVIHQLDNFILYLRSFRSDSGNSLGIPKNFEKKLTRLLSFISPVYAVGNPKEILPPIGAKRIYVGDEWKSTISDLMEKSRIITLMIDSTESVYWETYHCIKNDYLDKVLFISTNKESYSIFRERLNSEKILQLPEIEFNPLNIYFIYKDVTTNELTFIPTANLEKGIISFLNCHPVINEYNERKIELRKRLLINIFKNKLFPKEVTYFNLSVLVPLPYMIVNRWKEIFYVFLIMLIIISAVLSSYIPVLVYLIMLIIYANRISWLSYRWEGTIFFQKSQRNWNYLSIPCVFFYMFFIEIMNYLRKIYLN